MTGKDIVDTSGVLPAPRMASGNHPSAIAEEIAEICGAVIGVDISADADLFAAGLHSLDLVRIVGTLAKRYGVRLTAVDLLDRPTAESLARYINHRRDPGVHG